MTQENNQNPVLILKPKKKSFYVTEILMLKSIIVLLILTFFMLSELQAKIYRDQANNTVKKTEYIANSAE